jgi:4-hydroxybenzoate polyprenyltransferase
MVWNDVFDRTEDAAARAFRPIPSGRVTVRSAVVLGIVLLALGMGLAALAGLPGQPEWKPEPLAYAIGIAVAVLLYDGGLKRTPIGPLAMGSCRFLNVLFGLSLIPDQLLDMGLRFHLAGVVGIYIVGVTWFARTEESRSTRRQLIAAALVIALALVLGLVLKAKLQPSSGTFFFPYLLVAFGFLIGRPIAQALASPGPREVQSAIKRAVLGLVVLDAVLATAFAGLPALAILLLLPPALLLGKWVYST